MTDNSSPAGAAPLEHYGNERFFADLPQAFYQPVEIWGAIGLGHFQVMCVAADRFFAQAPEEGE